ncbi:MAG: hypothetical protein GC205_02250 [Bacteroidetes bacterium]|nr:hypothetical protein [Bacteroidota bacterium]
MRSAPPLRGLRIAARVLLWAAALLPVLLPGISTSVAQPAESPSPEGTADSSLTFYQPEYRKALIVPFDMTYYLSDADHELAERNGKTLAQVQQTLRYGMDGNVSASVMDLYSTHRILLDTMPDKNPDLMRLYGAIRYRYQAPFGVKPAAEQTPEKPQEVERPADALRRLFKDVRGQEDPLPETDQPDPYFEEGALRGPVLGRRTMHAELLDPEVLTYFYDRYGTDLFVFLNQLEIRTNYAHCLDRATNTFVREISVHYSIYDVSGKLFASDVVTVMVSSNTNDLYEVMARAFPVLSAAVVSGLPAPRYLRTEE